MSIRELSLGFSVFWLDVLFHPPQKQVRESGRSFAHPERKKYTYI
jgi:hypothetical protein